MQLSVVAISEKQKFQVMFRSRVKLWHQKTEIEQGMVTER